MGRKAGLGSDQASLALALGEAPMSFMSLVCLSRGERMRISKHRQLHVSFSEHLQHCQTQRKQRRSAPMKRAQVSTNEKSTGQHQQKEHRSAPTKRAQVSTNEKSTGQHQQRLHWVRKM